MLHTTMTHLSLSVEKFGLGSVTLFSIANHISSFTKMETIIKISYDNLQENHCFGSFHFHFY